MDTYLYQLTSFSPCLELMSKFVYDTPRKIAIIKSNVELEKCDGCFIYTFVIQSIVHPEIMCPGAKYYDYLDIF